MVSESEARLPPTFNRLAWSNLTAQSAEQIALAAAPIVAVLALGAGAGQAGLLQVALTLPFVLFALPTGLLADRMSRQQLMAGAEALRATALLGVLALIQIDLLSLPLLAMLGFIAVAGPSPTAWRLHRWCHRSFRRERSPPPMPASNSPARSPSPQAPPSAAPSSVGRAQGSPSALPPRCRAGLPSCW